MAKRLSFPTRVKKAGRRRGARKPFSAGTFIQRSRSESSEQKAMWHNTMGAGRSHVIREFVGLTDDEQAKCKDVLEQELGKRLAGMSR